MVNQTSTSHSTSSVDVENERRSKKKLDFVQEEDNRSESGSESESESESEYESGEEENASSEKQQGENAENENSKQKSVVDDSSDQQKGEVNVEKGLISANETPMNKVIDVQESLDAKASTSRSFKRKFSYEDEEKILQTLVNERVAHSFLAFWKNGKDSVQLSVPMSKVQISDKSRKLKTKYKKRFKKGKSPTKEHERHAYDLAKKLWGENGIEKQQLAIEEQRRHAKKMAKTGKKDEKKMIEAVEEDMDFRQDYANFLTRCKDGPFPIALALKVVKPSERSELEMMWKENCARDKKLMSKILKALRPPPAED